MHAPRTRTLAAAGLGLAILSCGSDAAPPAAPAGAESHADPPTDGAGDGSGTVHERLAAFLPSELAGRAVAVLESEGRAGRAVARGRYQALASDSRAVELEIFCGAGPEVRELEELFAARVGERVAIDGFEALVDESGRDEERRLEIWLRLDDTLWVRGTGPGPWESLRASVEAIDLRALADLVDDGGLSGAGARAADHDRRGAVVAASEASEFDVLTVLE